MLELKDIVKIYPAGGNPVEALKGKRGEDIVNADVESQGYEGTIAETNRKIEIK